MSMVLISGSGVARGSYAGLFARLVRDRRRELGLTITRAAELTGIEISEWLALEAGWVPREPRTIRTISETLQVRTSDLDGASLMSSLAQDETVQ